MFGLFGQRRDRESRRHVDLGAVDCTYVIGDVHGCHQHLLSLLDIIRSDMAAVDGRKLVVTLGDHIDRGPRSAAVMDWLCGPFWEDVERISLAGNHEAMMLDFLAEPTNGSIWLDNGGWQTLASYGIDTEVFERARAKDRRAMLDFAIPSEHIDLLHSMPSLATTSQATLVHAGIRPGIPLERQSDEDLLWIRQPFLDATFEDGPLIVHGHTPSVEPVIAGRRVCVDTGAYATGRLTALKITSHGLSFLQSAGPTP